MGYSVEGVLRIWGLRRVLLRVVVAIRVRLVRNRRVKLVSSSRLRHLSLAIEVALEVCRADECRREGVQLRRRR
jgi:hypothetical protein